MIIDMKSPQSHIKKRKKIKIGSANIIYDVEIIILIATVIVHIEKAMMKLTKYNCEEKLNF
jgi:hypothetical protein